MYTFNSKILIKRNVNEETVILKKIIPGDDSEPFAPYFEVESPSRISYTEDYQLAKSGFYYAINQLNQNKND